MNRKNTVLITGANGFIGGLLCQSLKKDHNVVGLSRKFKNGLVTCDINNVNELNKIKITTNPDVIIHAAGTKDLKFCENNIEEAHQINTNLVENVINTFQDCLIIYLSSDYVFFGDKGMSCEYDTPNPRTVYGQTKLEGENIGLKKCGKNFKIIRTASIFSKQSAFISFIEKNINLGKDVSAFEDSIISPTYIKQLTCAINQIIKYKYDQDIFHVCGKPVSRYEFARLYSMARLGNSTHILKAQANDNYPFLFKNLSLSAKLTNSILECNEIELEDAFKRIVANE